MSYIGVDFDPSDPLEDNFFGLDFLRDLPAGDSIASVSSWSLAVADRSPGADPNVGSRALAAPVIQGTAVAIHLAGLQDGVIYVLTFTVLTTLGHNISLSSYIPCRAVQ